MLFSFFVFNFACLPLFLIALHFCSCSLLTSNFSRIAHHNCMICTSFNVFCRSAHALWQHVCCFLCSSCPCLYISPCVDSLIGNNLSVQEADDSFTGNDTSSDESDGEILCLFLFVGRAGYGRMPFVVLAPRLSVFIFCFAMLYVIPYVIFGNHFFLVFDDMFFYHFYFVFYSTCLFHSVGTVQMRRKSAAICN